MKEARLSGEAFLDDVQAALERRGEMHIWWLGQSGFLVEFEGRHVLMDPYLSDSLTQKYAGTDRPHVRMTEKVIDPRKLNFIDVVTSSHNHTDHLDAETLIPLLEVNPSLAVVVPAANRDFAARRLRVEPGRLVAAEVGTPCRIADVDLEIHAVPAAHEDVERDAEGRHRFVGYVARFGDRSVYHSGDTVLCEGLVDAVRRWKIDVALLPINGRAPERGVAGNLSGREAARLAKDIGAGRVIPCHYDMFEFNTAPPDEFIAECERLGQPYAVLENGERWSA